MAINFNSLPTEKPATGNIIPKGQYIGTIAKSEMKQGKDPSKPPYLNIELDINDISSGTSMGKLWVILTESEAPLQRYQLSRFIKALELPITGEFDLKDLTKMINGKKLLIDVVPEDRNDGKEATKSVADVFSGDVFYPFKPAPVATPIADDELPFNASNNESPQPTMSAY